MVEEIRPLPEWEEIDPAVLSGTVFVLGGSDSGKSTFVRWMTERLCREGRTAGWLDADVGQSSLGVPTTLNLALLRQWRETPPPTATFFVGNTSPRGHMLPVLVGLHRLREKVNALGADVILVDTDGLVVPGAGGGALKEWQMELLRPRTVIAIQKERELEHLLGPLRRRSDTVLKILPVSPEVHRRSPEERTARRVGKYRDYFASARRLPLFLQGLPVYGLNKAAPGRLLSFLDAEGFSPALGILFESAPGRMDILTPLSGMGGIMGLRFGEICLDFADWKELA